MKREAVYAAAGWYPRDRENLEQILSRYVRPVESPMKALACMSPHAGYAYSGPVAGEVFSRMEVPSSVLVLSVNHRSHGAEPGFSLWSGGAWETPLGEAGIDEEFREALVENAPMLTPDTSVHMDEHSGELQLPFIKYRNPEARVNVIAVTEQGSGALVEAGRQVAKAIEICGRDVLIVASGDMSHEANRTPAYNRSQDEKTFPFVENVDPAGFHEAVTKHKVRTCGQGTFTLALAAAKELGALKGELVAWDSSGKGEDAVMDYVVSYAGFIVR